MSTTNADQLLALKQEAANAVVDVNEPTVKLVIFALSDRFFAFRGEFVKEVLPGDERLFYVPGMPSSVQGVINVRGDIESVILLNALLHLHEPEKVVSGSILLAKASGMRSGIRVDELLDVADLPLSQLQHPPESLPEALRPYVAALVDFSGKPIALLDIEKVFVDYQAGLG
ncbi:chemotaxis protein CheW [Halomonas vilamensis]|uniref:Chemotaxis protein CheW n=1 Tax=Vreelandella vilamensis TaxID=531309 RepID=A0ABU1H2I6_9GAMM|nr:chemotaxis protein CheW [Halomonas vilamensis]MDR5898496.1 chemotaxis protein CheW [Halomonas vilamensis]